MGFGSFVQAAFRSGRDFLNRIFGDDIIGLFLAVFANQEVFEIAEQASNALVVVGQLGFGKIKFKGKIGGIRFSKADAAQSFNGRRLRTQKGNMTQRKVSRIGICRRIGSIKGGGNFLERAGIYHFGKFGVNLCRHRPQHFAAGVIAQLLNPAESRFVMLGMPATDGGFVNFGIVACGDIFQIVFAEADFLTGSVNVCAGFENIKKFVFQVFNSTGWLPMKPR